MQVLKPVYMSEQKLNAFTKAELQLNQLKHKQLLILHFYKITLLNLYIT